MNTVLIPIIFHRCHFKFPIGFFYVLLQSVTNHQNYMYMANIWSSKLFQIAVNAAVSANIQNGDQLYKSNKNTQNMYISNNMHRYELDVRVWAYCHGLFGSQYDFKWWNPLWSFCKWGIFQLHFFSSALKKTLAHDDTVIQIIDEHFKQHYLKSAENLDKVLTKTRKRCNVKVHTH